MKYNLLRAKIVEHNMNNAKMAKCLGMSTNSFSRKMTGKTEFTLSEVEKLCSVLKIYNPNEIFFTSNIPNMQRTE